MVFSLFSAQPITVVGITGLISLFNYTIFHIIQMHDVSLYPQFMVWVGIWAAIFHWITAITNLCDYMRYVTDFSSNTFALYVGTIYIIKGVEEISVNFYNGTIANGFAAAMLAILFSITIYFLESIGSTTLFNGWTRTLLSDYAYPIATLFWTGFSHIPGNLSYVDFKRLPVSRAFYPTTNRPWVVDFWNLEAKWIFVAVPFGFLMTLLFYYDHNVSSLTAQARSFPLKKPAGFHWDFFLLGWTCLIAGIVDVPLPNGLVPQAPVHTDSLTDYLDQVKTIETTSGARLTRKETYPDHVVEQRISHFMMGLAIIGTMTGPLLKVLHTIPRALFSGVFFVVGWGSIEGNGIVAKVLFLCRERRFQQPSDPLLQVPRRQIAHFVAWQLLGWAATVAISQTVAAIGFPVLIVALIPLRWLLLPRLFTKDELLVMDNLTATNHVVLVSLGGRPEMPEVSRSQRQDLTAVDEEEEEKEPEKEEDTEIHVPRSRSFSTAADTATATAAAAEMGMSVIDRRRTLATAAPTAERLHADVEDQQRRRFMNLQWQDQAARRFEEELDRHFGVRRIRSVASR